MFAQLTLLFHFVWAGFILVPIPFIVCAKHLAWSWIRSLLFRTVHLVATAIVVVETLFSIPCPLTLLENRLRANNGQALYSQEGCVVYWMERLLGTSLPAASFTIFYLLLFGFVVYLYLRIPPKPSLIHRWTR